jgi:imidazolonepropionase-like amidohydrolase
MAAANSSGLTSPVGGAGAGREGGDGVLANLGGLLSVVDSSDLTSATATAGAGRDGVVDGEGGAGAGREDGVDGEVADLGGQVAADVDCCGSSNPSTLMFYSPEKAAASAVANVWKENPTSSSRFTSGFVGGIE